MTRRGLAPIERRHGPDYILLTAVLVLVVLGLIAVYSSSYALGYLDYSDPNYFIRRQVLFAAAGMAGLVVMTLIDYRILLRLSPLLILLALIGLGAALLPGIGVEQNGANRWIGIGPLVGQPSEFAKLAVIIYIAAWLSAKGAQVRDLALGVIPFVVTVGLVCSLVILEPDLDTTVLIALTAGTMFFVAGARLLHVLMLVGSAATFTVLFVLVGGYGFNRILSFTSAENDPQGAGFQTLQMLVAFGSGGISGLGLGVSRQKFFYVPGSHTDGVLAIIGEELGFIGTALVMLLFAIVLWRGIRIVRRSADPFGSLMAMGILAWFSFQLLMNVGGVTRMLPLMGIPLPLVSYGGTAIAMNLVAIGLLLSISRRADIQRPEDAVPSRGVVRPETARMTR